MQSEAGSCDAARSRAVGIERVRRRQAMKRRTSGTRVVAAPGTAFASSGRMDERRYGTSDRRASKRGGRRTTDTMRSHLDVLFLNWQELEMAAASPAVARPKPDDDESRAGRPPDGHVRRSLLPRK
jgi:hypothetical protein